MLRRRDAGESDRRLTILTVELGVIDVTAKGARKPASRLSGSTEPLTASILGIATGRNRFITQAQPISAFPGIRTDYNRLVAALALSELAIATLPHEQDAAAEFSAIMKALAYLDAGSDPLIWLIWAEMKLMALVGFQTEWNQCVVSGTQVDESPCWVSPKAGGYVSIPEAERFRDRFQVRAEVIYGVRAIQSLAEPPPRLKFASEALTMLVRFWESMIDAPLTANQQFVAQLKEGSASPE